MALSQLVNCPSGGMATGALVLGLVGLHCRGVEHAFPTPVALQNPQSLASENGSPHPPSPHLLVGFH